MSDKFTEEQLSVLAKVEKLMRLSARNPNENEAASAAAKAMELLAAYNLQSASIDIDGETSAKRAEEKMIGGFYQYERDLWRAISELNFVWYFSRSQRVPVKDIRRNVMRRQHILIGKVVNIAATKGMAGYLAQTIERITREQMVKYNVHLLSAWSNSFRRGMAERIIEKVNQRRWDLLDAEDKAAAQAAKKAAEDGSVTLETGLTLRGVQAREDEGNYDFIHGKGAWAENQKRQLEWQARRAEARAKAEAEYTAWAQANPEEAAKEEAKRIKAERRRSNYLPRYRSGPSFKGDLGAYSLGREMGKNIGVDPQAEGRTSKGELR